MVAATGRAVIVEIRNREDLDHWRQELLHNTSLGVGAVQALGGSPLEILASVKFDPIGRHPLEDRPLNFIEQVNQTFTYWVALRATELLLDWHPEVGGFRLAPGAHAPRGTLDIESLDAGLVGAETFAGPPSNNRKLAGDLGKLAARPEEHRYVFFTAPKFNETLRQLKLEKNGVQVWSLALTEHPTTP